MTLPSVPALPAPAVWFAGVHLSGPPEAAVRQIVGRTREYVRQGHARLEARHRAGAGGREGVAARAALMDGLLQALFGLAATRAGIAPPGRVALVAIGGYGRGELSPGSDIDLILLHAETRAEAVERLAQGLLYPLWDAGLEVGSSVRTVAECLEVAQADLRTCTALLDLRCLAGDAGLAATLAQVLDREVLGRDREGFIRRKLQEQAERREKFGSSVYMLEPHVKEGEGGLRDIQTAIWVAHVRFGATDLQELQARGVLSDKERLAFERALEFLWRVRNALHYASGRKADQLTFELQARVAREFGYEDRPGHQAGEQFLRAYYQVAAEVEYYSTLLIARASRPGAGSAETRPLGHGFTLWGGLIRADLEALWWDPLNLLRAFVLCQEHQAELDSTTQEQILAALPAAAPELRASPEAARLFRRILGAAWGVARTLRQMNRLQVLGGYLPEFGSLYCRVQYEMYHVYTVDQHSIQAVEELERLRSGEAAGQDPELAALMAEAPAPEILYLGALLHDLGKGKGGEHERRALDLLPALTARLQLAPAEAELVAFLVEHHLLMSHLAQHRDLNDDALLRRFAQTVGDVERLRALYLLTVADMRAVGPHVWTDWKAALLAELYFKARRILEGKSWRADAAVRIEEVQDAVRQRLQGSFRSREIEAYFDSLDPSYFLANSPEAIAEHLRVAEGMGEAPLATRVTHRPQEGSSELLVCTRDRPGLFAMIAGVLAAHGINILGAQIFTRSNGLVVDVLQVDSPAGGAILDQARWDVALASLRDVLIRVVSVEALIARRRRPSVLRPKVRPPVATQVRIDNEASDRYTVLDIYTRDRIGLLYDITHTLFAQGLNIYLARVTTHFDQAADVFYVEQSGGGKITDPGRLEAIRQALLQALEGDAIDAPAPF